MKRTLYLHIGCPKTGTSSLQTMFGLHPHLLTDAGFACPPIRTGGLGMPRIDYSDIYKKIYNRDTKLWKEINSLFGKTEKFFLSNENLCGFPQESISHFISLLKEHDVAVILIMTVRNLYNFYYSRYKEDCYFAGYYGSLRDYIHMLKTGKQLKNISYDFLQGLKHFTDTGHIDKTHILHYDQLKRETNKRICAILGTGYEEIKDENISFTFSENENLRHTIKKIVEDSHNSTLLTSKSLSRMLYFNYRVFSEGKQRKQEKGIPYDNEVYSILESVFKNKIQDFNKTYNTQLCILDASERTFSYQEHNDVVDEDFIKKTAFSTARFINSTTYEHDWKFTYLQLRKLLSLPFSPRLHDDIRKQGGDLLPHIPDSTEGLRARADILLRARREPDSATPIYAKILASPEARKNDWERLLFCHQVLGRDSEAQEVLRQGAGRFCTGDDVASRSAHIHYLCGNLAEAEALCLRLVADAPASYACIKLLYRILYAQGQLSRAADALEGYSANCTKHGLPLTDPGDLHIHEGLLCMQLRRWDEAARFLTADDARNRGEAWITALASAALEQCGEARAAAGLWDKESNAPGWAELRGLFAVRNQTGPDSWLVTGEAALQRDSGSIFLAGLFPGDEQTRRRWLLQGVFLGEKPHDFLDPFFCLSHNRDILLRGGNPLAHYTADPMQWTTPAFFGLRFAVQHPEWPRHGATPLAAALAQSGKYGTRGVSPLKKAERETTGRML